MTDLILAQIWPTTIDGWIAVGVGVLALIAPPATLFYRLGRLQGGIDDKFRNQGERLGHVEREADVNQAAIHDMQRKVQQQEFLQAEVARQIGETRGGLDRIASALDGFQRSRSEEERQIGEKLVRIEEQLKYLREMMGRRSTAARP